MPAELKPRAPGPQSVTLSWWQLMTHWDYVVADLQQHYGISEYAVQDAPWPWFYTIVRALVEIPDSRVTALLNTQN